MNLREAKAERRTSLCYNTSNAYFLHLEEWDDDEKGFRLNIYGISKILKWVELNIKRRSMEICVFVLPSL